MPQHRNSVSLNLPIGKTPIEQRPKMSPLVFIGHISLDEVRSPSGVNSQLGGGALYAAMGAKVLSDDVRIISAVGHDFGHLPFLYSTFPKSYIKRVNTPTTRFKMTYNENFAARYEAIEIGAGAHIRTSDLKWVPRGGYVHLAPINPLKAKRFVEAIRARQAGAWISMHTSQDYLESSASRRILRRLAETVDLFVLNDAEALALSAKDSVVSAVQTLKARRLAVTLGQWGAILSEGRRIEMIPALSSLAKRPRDTTGAGDTWCGTLLAAYSITKEWTKSVVTACLVSALKCMDWSIGRIKDLRFKHPDEVVTYVLSLKDGSVQLTLKSFMK